MPDDKETLDSQIRTTTVVKELKNRGVSDDYCPRCGVFDWSVDFLELVARPAAYPSGGFLDSELTFNQPLPSGFMRVVCFVCKNCGYAVFHDLSVLEKRNG